MSRYAIATGCPTVSRGGSLLFRRVTSAGTPFSLAVQGGLQQQAGDGTRNVAHGRPSRPPLLISSLAAPGAFGATAVALLLLRSARFFADFSASSMK